MKRTKGDDNALQFLFAMPRVDFTPSDCVHWFGTIDGRKWLFASGIVGHGIPATASGWRKRLARLAQLGLLNRICGSAYEFTQEGLLAVNLAKGGVSHE